MCLIVFSWNPSSQQLRLVANRDEFHARPTAALDWWQDTQHILAGRDLQAGGTWLGLSSRGRFAALTNVRQAPERSAGQRSRGHLVRDFLRSTAAPAAWLDTITADAGAYAGFNLLTLADGELWYYSNTESVAPQRLEQGLYGVSNAGLNTPWPKLLVARDALAALPADADLEQYLNVTARREGFADQQLPDTGVGLSLERLLAPPFIVSPRYGTRCTTALNWVDDQAQILERSFAPDGRATGSIHQRLHPAPVSATD